MVNHGVSTGALFLVVGFLIARRRTRLVTEYGGVAQAAPLLAGAYDWSCWPARHYLGEPVEVAYNQEDGTLHRFLANNTVLATGVRDDEVAGGRMGDLVTAVRAVGVRQPPQLAMPTVPAGYAPANRRPFGVSLLGQAWSEPTLIGYAYAYEQATRLRRPPSEINPALFRSVPS